MRGVRLTEQEHLLHVSLCSPQSILKLVECEQTFLFLTLHTHFIISQFNLSNGECKRQQIFRSIKIHFEL